MSNNFQYQEPSDFQKKERAKPKNIVGGNTKERDGSKTAPAEQDLVLYNCLYKLT